MKCETWRWPVAVAFIACASSSAVQAQSGAADDAAAGQLVGDQVREQGLVCAEPVTATRDPSVSDDAVWMLTCADAKYRVRLVPDQAAVVERLD